MEFYNLYFHYIH